MLPSRESTETPCFYRNGVHHPAPMEHSETAPRNNTSRGDLVGAMVGIAFCLALGLGLLDGLVRAAAEFLR